ncbi:MAG TPA: DNA polymerase, partial [bacterium]|nr:DNA polymerase [bacterium]
MSKLFIIDGNSYIHRAYHALPPLTNSRGEPVGALFGFTRMLVKIIRKEKPDYMLVCFDSPQPTFRHEEYKEYKATRKETDEDLRRQLPLSRDVVEGMGLNYVAEPGLEADDLIAGAVEKFGREKDLDIFIVSGDKDIYQLVGDKVFVYNEPKNRVFDAAGVREIFGIPAGNITDYLALAGDSSDNIPGVRGIGPRTAVQLLSEFPSLDKIYSNLESVPPKIREKLEAGRDNAFLSRKLAVLARPEIKMSRDDLALGEWQTEKLVKMLERFEFTSILKEIDLPVCKAVSGEVITSGDRLKEIIKEITNMQIFNAILIQKDNNDLGIVFGGENNYFLPFGEMQESLFGERDRDMIRLFKDLIENGNVRKDSGDLKKLLRFFRARGIEMKGLHADTGILSYLVNPERDHSLGRLAAEYLQSRLEEPEDVSGTPAFAYASLDILRRVTEPLFRELENAGLGRLYRDVELPLVRIIAEMEDRGVLVDLDFFGEFSKKVSAELSGIEDKIRALCGKECNLNSPKQLAEVLFHKLNLPVIKRGKTGPSTSEEVLIELSALHPLPGLILQYREVEKIRSTYVDPVWDLVGEDGRLHPTFHQNVTATGRLSSS